MHEEHRDIAPDWYARAFDALYPILYAHRSVEAARPEAVFAAQELELTGSERVLDLCCGNGRHMNHLEAFCARLTGLDYSMDLLREAREMLGHGCALVRADMRAIPFDSCFDAIANFFTSFGYFIDAEDNLKVVLGLAGALKPGGRFFIDYVNKESAITNLIPESTRHHDLWDIQEQRWFDEARIRLNKRTTVTHDGDTVRVVEESVRLYSPREFESLLRAGGLRVEALYGDYSGIGLDAASPRMIAIGRKE